MNDTQLEKILITLTERRSAEQKQSTFERHAQTVLTSLVVIILAAFGTGGWSMLETQNKLVTGQKVANIITQNLTDQIEDQSASYASKVDMLLFHQKIDARVRALEEKYAK